MFSVDQLKDIVSEHAMDSSKLALKWRSPDRLIELIVTTVRSRIEKGDAFKRDFVSQDTGASDKQQGWNDALNIVLGQFHDVAWQKGLYQERTRAAEDMKKLAKYEGREKSQDYQQAMANVVRPFYNMLKGDPQGQPPFNT